MTVDKVSYELGHGNYIAQGTKKNRIIIGNTFTSDMNHVTGWKKRYGGRYKRTAMFTIDLDGTIYQHFSPHYFSKFTEDEDVNETSISILLVNEGWLTKDLKEENRFINYVGHIYKRNDSVVEKRWKGLVYWAPYTSEQVESALTLVKELCREFHIPLKAIPHNTSFDTADTYEGIIYKSNLNKQYTDVNSSWDCLSFKNKIEIN